jgi:hypothetical protein
MAAESGWTTPAPREQSPFGALLAFVLMTYTLVLIVASNVLGQRRYRR